MRPGQEAHPTLKLRRACGMLAFAMEVRNWLRFSTYNQHGWALYLVGVTMEINLQVSCVPAFVRSEISRTDPNGTRNTFSKRPTRLILVSWIFEVVRFVAGSLRRKHAPMRCTASPAAAPKPFGAAGDPDRSRRNSLRPAHVLAGRRAAARWVSISDPVGWLRRKGYASQAWQWPADALLLPGRSGQLRRQPR